MSSRKNIDFKHRLPSPSCKFRLRWRTTITFFSSVFEFRGIFFFFFVIFFMTTSTSYSFSAVPKVRSRTPPPPAVPATVNTPTRVPSARRTGPNAPCEKKKTVFSSLKRMRKKKRRARLLGRFNFPPKSPFLFTKFINVLDSPIVSMRLFSPMDIGILH